MTTCKGGDSSEDGTRVSSHVAYVIDVAIKSKNNWKITKNENKKKKRSVIDVAIQCGTV